MKKATPPFDGCSDGAPRPPFKPVAVGAYAVMQSAQWIIKNVLPRAALAVIFGESGSGKSFLALDMAFAIVRALAWYGHKTIQGRVVYLAAEGAQGFRNRLLAYALHHKIDLNDITNFDIVPDCPDFLHNDGAAVALQIGKADVIFVDTLARVMPGGNENSGEHLGKVIAECTTLHEKTSALIVLVHHTGKDNEKGARGWSGLKAATDCEIEVIRGLDNRLAQVTKQKDGEGGEKFGFKLEAETLAYDDDGDGITSCVIIPEAVQGYRKPPAKLGPIQQKVMDIVNAKTEYFIDVTEVIDAVIKEIPYDGKGRDIRRRNVTRAVETLQETGFIKITDNKIYR